MKTQNSNLNKMIGAACAMILSAASSQAVDRFWINPVTDSFTNTANWTGGVLPNGGDNAINNSGAGNSVLINAGDPDWTINDIRSGDGAGNSDETADPHPLRRLVGHLIVIDLAFPECGQGVGFPEAALPAQAIAQVELEIPGPLAHEGEPGAARRTRCAQWQHLPQGGQPQPELRFGLGMAALHIQR